MRFPRIRSQSSKKFTPVLIGGLLIASTLLSPQSAEASITITSNEAEAFASDAIGAGVIQTFNGTAIPTSTVLNAADGTASSRNVIDWSTSGGQTILSLDMEHQRRGATYSTALTFDTVTFTVDSSSTYALSGFYNVTDVGASESGYVFQYASLQDLSDPSSVYLFQSYNESVDTHNEQLIIGTVGSDGNAFTSGSLTGNLIAGHNYAFYFNAEIQAIPDGDSGASAVGNFTLTIGEAGAGAVPEPLSLFVWSLLGITAGGIIYQRRSRRLA